MAEHPNAALLRRGHQAFSKGDQATLAEVIAEDVLWHTAGKGMVSGPYHGRDAVFGFFAKLAELTDGTLTIEDQDFLACDERAVALFKIKATRGSKTLDADCCEVVRVQNSQVVEEWNFAFDQHREYAGPVDLQRRWQR